MIRNTFLFGAAALTLGAVQSPSAAPTPRLLERCDHNPTLPYDRPIEFTQTALDGPDIVLSAYRGKPVWINIFAAWCEDCNREQPVVSRLAKEFGEQGLQVIGVDCAEADETVREYVRRYEMAYPIAMDRKGGLSQGLTVGQTASVFNLPSHLFLDRNGFLVCYRGDTLGEKELRSKLTALVKG